MLHRCDEKKKTNPEVLVCYDACPHDSNSSMKLCQHRALNTTQLFGVKKSSPYSLVAVVTRQQMGFFQYSFNPLRQITLCILPIRETL